MSSVNRLYKDRLFRLLFADEKNKANALALYNALNNSNYTNVEELEFNTLDNVIHLGMKNLLTIPTPRFVVFYNGTDKRPAIEKLRLSKAFLIPDSSGEFEWTATVINLNHEDNSDLLERCRPLYEYTTLISRIQNYKDQGLTIETAVDIAVDECIRDGILVDFLTAHRTEVLQLFLEELDEQFFINGVKEEALQEERQRQQEKLKEKIKRKIAKGLSLEQTAEELEEDVETIRPYYEELIAQEL